jgi:hypothetical protein
MTLRRSFLVAVIVVLGLSGLAFWPTGAWAPPRRPALKGPVVFDEFVDASNATRASSQQK